jgi:alkylhydroperoxidase family enzyme
VLAVQRDFRNAGLPEREVAMLAYAEKIARNAAEVGEADIAALREAGFSDLEICDIAVCASFRCFVSRFFDAVGADPDAVYLDPDPEFREAMTVGKRN